MKVFLAGIIQGSLVEAAIHEQDWREPIKDILSRHVPGADVYCHYSEHPNSITYDLAEIRRTLTDGIERAAASDLVVAWCPSASMGTAIEIYEACRNHAAVLTISPLSANWVIRAYSDQLFAGLEEFEAFLASPEFGQLMDDKRRARQAGGQVP